MYYIHTANPLERTARWLERMDGGIEYLRTVIVDDVLGLCADLEHDMQALVDSYACEWAEVVRDPERRAAFRLASGTATGAGAGFVRERGQKRPADWPETRPEPLATIAPEPTSWVRVARAVDVPADGGVTIDYGGYQIAVFNFVSAGGWYATQASCPHRKDEVLGRGLLGSQAGEPKVACPLHKKTFSLVSGAGLSDAQYAIRTFSVELRDGDVYVELPPPAALLAPASCGAAAACATALADRQVQA
jgi:nitrite reductase (NADH) large subunit